MKTYNDGYVMRFAPIDSEWVPAEVARGLYEALAKAAEDLDMLARVERNYLAKSGADKARAALKATEES